MKQLIPGLFALLLAACAQMQEAPDLKRLYALQTDPEQRQPPVVVLHGIMGSRLNAHDTGKEIWPGSLWKLLFNDYETLRLDIDPDTLMPVATRLEVAGITDRAAGRDFYGRILEVLEEAGGFARADPGTPISPDEKHYYVFTYDWRQDNVHTARALDAFIERIREDYGEPDLKVDIIAHSMGGLISRYYIRYGTIDVLDDNEFPVNNHGAGRVRRVILLGTPSLGSVKAITTFIRGFKLGFGAIPPEVVATFPSSYQLLPHPLNNWLIMADGRELDRDLFEVKFWQRFEFAVFNQEVQEKIIRQYPTREEGGQYLDVLHEYFKKHIERGRRFVWSLTVPVPEAQVRYVVFGGDCQLTPARVLVEEVNGESVMRLYPHEVKYPEPGVDYDALMLEPGDGVVTKASLQARVALDPTVTQHRHSYFPMRYVFFLCESHDRLTGNINFQDNLLHAILSADAN